MVSVPLVRVRLSLPQTIEAFVSGRRAGSSHFGFSPRFHFIAK